MPADSIHVLLVEDDPGDARLVRELLRGIPDAQIYQVDRLAAGIEYLAVFKVDVVVLDLGLPDSIGLPTLRTFLEAGHGVPVVVLTGLDDDATGKEALRAGAQDYLVKGRLAEAEFTRAVRYAFERNSALTRLRESEERYRLLAENATDVIWVLDADSQTFKFVSPSVERMLGFTDKELVGRSLARTVTPTSLSFIESVTRGRIEGLLRGQRDVFTDEIEVFHKDGHVVPTEVNLQFLVNRTTGLVEGTGVMRDMTARKRARDRNQLARDVLELLNSQRQGSNSIATLCA